MTRLSRTIAERFEEATGLADAALLAKIVDLCGQHGVPGINPQSERRELRTCNAAIVERKVNGDPSVQVGPPLPVEVVTNSDRRKALGKRFGAKGIVFRNLRVRAVNAGSLAVADALVRLYEGNGLTRDSYTTLNRDHTIARLAEGSSHVIEVIDATPAYPLAFWMPGLTPNGARAVAFFLDPERRFPERDKAGRFCGLLLLQAQPGLSRRSDRAAGAADASDPGCGA